MYTGSYQRELDPVVYTGSYQVSGWTRGHPLRVLTPDKQQKLFSPLFWKTEERIVMSALLWTSPACHFISLRFSSLIDDIAVAHFLPSFFPFSLSFPLFLSFFLLKAIHVHRVFTLKTMFTFCIWFSLNSPSSDFFFLPKFSRHLGIQFVFY